MFSNWVRGQDQLRGGLQHVSDTQANAQVQVIQTVESRLSSVQQQMNDRLADNAMKSARALAEMQERMKESLHGSSKQTATSLTQLQERLAAIDKAQDNITKLSGDVLSLQDILSNKQTRGAFGEIQLNDIVSKALADRQFLASGDTVERPSRGLSDPSAEPARAYRDRQ